MIPGQVIFITGDQPVYGLDKQLQRMFQEEIKNVIWLLGPLHIEQNFILLIRDLLEGSGWTKIYEYSTTITSGRAEGSGVSGIKRSRYAHQVTLSALTTLASDDFHTQSEYSDYKDWRQSLQRKYWFSFMELEILLFTFIRGLCNSNFDLFVSCFEEMLPLMEFF